VSRTAWVLVVLVASVALVIAWTRDGEETVTAPEPAVGEVPTFEVDPTWPTIPDGWVLGVVASVAVDGRDHVWVLQRPSSLPREEAAMAAPPVLEFDAQGNFERGWGGPNPEYHWPESEHGIYVDHNDYVWVGGNGPDDQVLKFTMDGEFVMQIGQPGDSEGNLDTENLGRPADVWVHPPTNELFVADGYGNRRVIVYDAETGEFRRMWGAFGNEPTDGEPDPSWAEEQEGVGPPQFVPPVHAAKVSNDGLVYVSDRAGKRVQVFSIEGEYVSQVFIGRECLAPECGNGTTAASTAFSADPEQRFLYVGNRSQARVMVLERETLEILDGFGRSGSAPGEFGTLHHMDVDSRGNLYVTEVTPLDRVNRRVQKFILTGMRPRRGGSAGGP
jgi:DNA-binding beta-propeller fold protein YncE